MSQTLVSQLDRLSPLVQRLRAPNPGPMTLTGTNSYLIGKENGEIVVIDPGPEIPTHLEALALNAEKSGGFISTILVTHGHPDHFPGAYRLKEMTGARIGAFKEAEFQHDFDLVDRSQVKVGETTLTAIFTPGHAVDHLCYFLEEEQALFTGDMILGVGTVIVAPPKGNMATYLISLGILEKQWEHARVIYGGHGPEVSNPAAKIQEYISHRQARERQLIKALESGASTIPEIVAQIYQDVDKKLWPAAARQVMAYLIMLESQGRVAVEKEREVLDEEAAWLWPAGSIDPVAAAELGFDQATEKIKHYQLVSGGN